MNDLVGEIGCVTARIQGSTPGIVKIFSSDYPAVSTMVVERGRWVRVTKMIDGSCVVEPLNVWLGSCCC